MDLKQLMLRPTPKQDIRTEDSSNGVSSNGVSLMPGESIQASVGRYEYAAARKDDALLLTDTRIIHISYSDANHSKTIAALDDIGAVELTQRPVGGYGAFIWAALAFFVAFMLWRVVDSQWLSVSAAVIVGLMGVYLIADRLMSRGERLLVFRSSGGQLRVELNGEERQSEAEALTARLFELKEQRGAPRYTSASRFSPR